MSTQSLIQIVERTYQMGVRFEGASIKERRNRKQAAVKIVRGYQQELYQKNTPERVKIALQTVKENPSLSGVKGVGKLRPLLADCSNLGEAAYLPLLEAVKGTIVREKKLQKAFELLIANPTEAVEWFIFGRSPYIEGKLQYHYHHPHKYIADMLIGARRKLNRFLSTQDQLTGPLPCCSPKELRIAINTFHNRIVTEFESQSLSSAQKAFLRKLERLSTYRDELADLLSKWLVEWNNPESTNNSSNSSNPITTITTSRWRGFNVFCKQVSEWLAVKSRKGVNKTRSYAYRSVLRGILLTALLPHYADGKTVVQLLKTGDYPLTTLVGLPFSKAKATHEKKLPLHLLMGKKYVVERPGNAKQMTEIVRQTGELDLWFWPYRQYKQRFCGKIRFHKKVLSFIQQGATIKLLSLVATDAPSSKILVSVVLAGEYGFFLSAKKIVTYSNTLKEQLLQSEGHLSSGTDALGVDVNRLGEHMLAFSGESITIPSEVLRLVDRYTHLETVISQLSRGLIRRKVLFKKYPSASRHKSWLKVKGELSRVYSRHARLLREIHRCCSQLTTSVVLALSVRLLCVEDLILTAKGTYGALAKIILSLPDEADLFTRAVLVATWFTGRDVSLVRVDPRGTSRTPHYNCPSPPSSGPIVLRRSAGSWDEVICPSCGQLVNTHINAAYFIRDSGIRLASSSSRADSSLSSYFGRSQAAGNISPYSFN